MEERVILVDANDVETGTEEKMSAHRQGKLHRAFSVFVFNEQGKLLLQKRNKNKYHSGGLWTNTCCSHPRPGEGVLEAAHRRLREEMGFDCELNELFSFVYEAKLDRGLTEHEYDHVIVGTFNSKPSPNPDEVEEWKWVTLDELDSGIKSNPGSYSYWLRACFDQLHGRLKNSKTNAGKEAQEPTRGEPTRGKSAVDFFCYKFRDDIETALKGLLPGEITISWVEGAIGKTLWQHDTEALTSAISKPAWDLLSRGGKRLRPMLMLLCCEAVGGRPEGIIPFTAIPEIIHNGSLIADDIEDNSELRRGKPAVHKVFGTDIAINASSTLYFIPQIVIRDSKLPPETKLRAYDTINTQLLKCCLGQAIDIYWHSGKSSKIPTEQEYLQMCANKTGSVASMAAKLGALLGGGSEEQIEALGRFAEAAGVAFQIQDDILNIERAAGIGKEFGDDIKEGKRTLLVIHTLNFAPEAERKRLLEILNMHTSEEKFLAEAIDIIRRNGSIEYVKSVAKDIADKAWEDVDHVLPESEAKKQLKELTKLLIDRLV